MKKIIFFLRSFTPGGIEKVLITVLNEIAKYQDVYIVVVRPEGKLMSTIRIPKEKILAMNNIHLSKTLIPFHKIIKQINPDIIITGGDIPNCIAVLEKKIFRGKFKVIISQHNYENSETKYLKRIKYLLSYLYKEADTIIAVSNGIKQYLSNDLKIPEDRIKIIYNPIDVEECKRLADRELSINFDYKNNRYVLFCGRLSTVKNLLLTIKAFKMIEDKNIKLLICGEGPEEQKLKIAVEELHLEDRICFCGAVNNVFPLIKHCVVGIMSSTSEAFPMFVLELYSLGKILVSTPTNGAIEIVNSKKDVFLSKDFSDVNSFAEVLKNGIRESANLELKNSLIRRALDFDKNKIIAEYKEQLDL